ncbi:MAG: hypothetical protein O7A04_11750, partial [Acidobacteria bacterium]|nr:hypothetical protein [Acidobacteriota bacterium]
MDQVQAGTYRPLGVVLMGPGIAKISERAIAHKLGDVALEAADGVGAGFLVGADHLAQVFGVEPLGERRRAHQIDEHHRELASLSLGSGG